MRNNEINQQIMAAQPHQLCTLIAARKAEFDHVHMATAFRKLLQSRRDGVPHRVVERALQALEESALEKIEDFQSKQLATTLHAMAKDRYHPSNPRVLEALEQQAAATASTFNAQEVTNTLLAYAKMGRAPGAGLMWGLEGRAEAVAGTFNAQGVTITLWAYATMGRTPGTGLMNVLQGRAEAVAGTFNAQNVANTLWAYATMGQEPGAGLMRVLEGRAEVIAGTFDSQHVTNTLWGGCVFATLRVVEEESRWMQGVAATGVPGRGWLLQRLRSVPAPSVLFVVHLGTEASQQVSETLLTNCASWGCRWRSRFDAQSRSIPLTCSCTTAPWRFEARESAGEDLGQWTRSFALPCERDTNRGNTAEATASATAGSRSRQRALLGVGQVPGSRKEGAVPEGQVETVGNFEKLRILYWWTQARAARI